jgi:hypothetical protein
MGKGKGGEAAVESERSTKTVFEKMEGLWMMDDDG